MSKKDQEAAAQEAAAQEAARPGLTRNELVLDAAKISWGVRLQKGADPAKAATDALVAGEIFADAVQDHFSEQKDAKKGS